MRHGGKVLAATAVLAGLVASGPAVQASEDPGCAAGVRFTSNYTEAASGLRVMSVEVANCGAEALQLNGYPQVSLFDRGTAAAGRRDPRRHRRHHDPRRFQRPAAADHRAAGGDCRQRVRVAEHEHVAGAAAGRQARRTGDRSGRRSATVDRRVAAAEHPHRPRQHGTDGRSRLVPLAV